MRSHNVIIAAGFIGALALADAAYAMSAGDFVQKASVANEFEIESSKLALEKSQNKDIKTFAQRMVNDHTKTGEQLESTLKSSQSDIQPQDKLDAKHQRMMDKLESLSTDDFNAQYISMQTDAHKEAVSLFGDYAKSGKDPALQKFAADTLPTLQDHLKHVKMLKANS